MRILIVLCSIALGVPARPARAQTAGGQPPATGGITVAGSLRTRGYSWNWFGENPNGDYSYPASLVRLALSRSTPPLDWQIEFAIPVLVNLPSGAVAPAPEGQLGLGAAYFAANANSTSAAALFLKQGFIRFKRLGGIAGQSLSLGRMEFNDGAEVVPKNGALAALKRDRISQRLIGTFGFTDVGRSIDGAQYSLSTTRLNVTAIGGRPTRGVFDVNGWPELDVTLLYGALTGQAGGERAPAEWRVFGLGYADSRHLAGRPDNRPVPARNADSSSISIATLGGHYIRVTETRGGPVDLLIWTAVQIGSWGALSHRAGAFAAEIGWQPRAPARLKPWIRGGYDYGSGDADPGDQAHGTFFQIMPTPRVYARLPFYNMMNSRDAFGEVVVRPAARVTVRTDVHAVDLADANDLWYSGGGAFQPSTFGYTGRPSNGGTRLATLYDASAEWNMNAHVTLGGYYAYAAGGGVSQSIYRTGNAAHFGYGEVLLRF